MKQQLALKGLERYETSDGETAFRLIVAKPIKTHKELFTDGKSYKRVPAASEVPAGWTPVVTRGGGKPRTESLITKEIADLERQIRYPTPHRKGASALEIEFVESTNKNKATSPEARQRIKDAIAVREKELAALKGDTVDETKPTQADVGKAAEIERAQAKYDKKFPKNPRKIIDIQIVNGKKKAIFQ